MTYKHFEETYEVISKAKETCGTPNCCSTCMYCRWGCDTDDYPAEKSMEARCMIVVRKGEGA